MCHLALSSLLLPSENWRVGSLPGGSSLYILSTKKCVLFFGSENGCRFRTCGSLSFTVNVGGSNRIRNGCFPGFPILILCFFPGFACSSLFIALITSKHKKMNKPNSVEKKAGSLTVEMESYCLEWHKEREKMIYLDQNYFLSVKSNAKSRNSRAWTLLAALFRSINIPIQFNIHASAK